MPAANDTLLETFGTTEAAVEAERPGDPYPRILEEVLRRLSTHWQVTSSDAEIAEFGQSVGRWPAFPDSPEALAYLATMWINRRKALGGGWGATPAPSASADATRPDYEVGSMSEFAARHRESAAARG